MHVYADSRVIAAGRRCHSTQEPLRLHEKRISLAQILSGSCLAEELLLERDECRWSLHWRDAKWRKKCKGGRNSILLERWGMMECCSKWGQNCNNSCRLLRNTECFPAIWINKHSLDPLRPRLSFSPNGFVGVPSAALSNRTCFQLTLMKEEITASLRFLALGTAALGPRLWFCISSHAVCVFQWIQINRSHIASSLLLRSRWGD